MTPVKAISAIIAWGLFTSATPVGSPAPPADLIARAAGQPCTPLEADSLLTFSIVIGANGAKCSVYTLGPVVYASARYESPHGTIPLLLIRSAGAPDRGIIVYLPGGPGGGLLPQAEQSPTTTMLTNLAEQGFTVVGLGYSGSVYSSVGGSGTDLDRASRQTEDYLKYLRGAGAKVRAVLGVSAGAHVALGTRSAPTVPIILLSPAVQSPESLVQRMKQKREGLAYYSRTVRGGITEETRTADFFGQSYSRDLAASLIASGPPMGECLSVLIGSEDDRVGLDGIDRLESRIPTLRVRLIASLGHGPRSEPEAKKLAALLAQEVESSRCYERITAR